MKLFNVYFSVITPENKYISHHTFVCVKGRKGSYQLTTDFSDKFETVYKFTADSPRHAVMKYLEQLADETNTTLESPAIYELPLNWR